MIITEISPQKKKGRYNIYVDNEFFSGIDAMSLLQFSLKVGSEVDKDHLREIVFESEVRSAFDKLASILKTPQSKKQVRGKLLGRGYGADVVDAAIKKAEEYGYLNDEEYAKMLVSSKPLKSRLEIKNSLFEKGLSQEIIKSATECISEESERERAKMLAEKYMKNKENSVKNISSLYAFLMRKGFSGEIVRGTIKCFRTDLDEIE